MNSRWNIISSLTNSDIVFKIIDLNVMIILLKNMQAHNKKFIDHMWFEIRS